VIKSSAFLYIRQILGIFFSFFTLYFAVRIFSHRDYGIYTSVMGVQAFTQIVLMFGCNTFLYKSAVNKDGLNYFLI